MKRKKIINAREDFESVQPTVMTQSQRVKVNRFSGVADFEYGLTYRSKQDSAVGVVSLEDCSRSAVPARSPP